MGGFVLVLTRRCTVLTALGAYLTRFRRELAGRAVVASRLCFHARCRRIRSCRAVFARRGGIRTQRIAPLPRDAQFALCLVGFGVLARATFSAATAGAGAHPAGIARDTNTCAHGSGRHFFACVTFCTDSLPGFAICVITFRAIRAARLFLLRVDCISPAGFARGLAVLVFITSRQTRKAVGGTRLVLCSTRTALYACGCL